MAELLILEFDGFTQDVYDRVNEALGINPDTGEGDWPPGLLSHAAGATDGGWRVVEVWDSQADQEAFMSSRLGEALQKGGADKPPSRAEWTSLRAHNQPRQKAAAG
jgi:hypothetical protein